VTFTSEQTKDLSDPLDPRHIKPPPRGKFGSYVDGHHIISEANRIFGYDGWSYTVTLMDLCSRIETVDSNNKPQVRVGYRCMVRVEVAGVVREGAAVGSGMAKPENEADAHESAVKEAETDALKRALRSFGNTFGLALYDKADDNQNIGLPRPAAITDEQRIELVTLFDHLGVPVAEFLAIGKIKDLRELEATRFEGAKTWINKRALELRAANQKAA